MTKGGKEPISGERLAVCCQDNSHQNLYLEHGALLIDFMLIINVKVLSPPPTRNHLSIAKLLGLGTEMFTPDSHLYLDSFISTFSTFTTVSPNQRFIVRSNFNLNSIVQ